MKDTVLTKQNKTDPNFCMLLSTPVETGYFKHFGIFFGRAFVTSVDADFNKHKSWSMA